MAYTNSGLIYDGNTIHYSMSYDTTLSPADGVDRLNGLLDMCEADFEIMRLWFGNIEISPLQYPIKVQLATGAATGASWTAPPPADAIFGDQPTLVLQPGVGTSVDLLRYLLVSEVTEMFMLAQNKGWYYPGGPFSTGDEGSKGEGLSRFLSGQFLILANGSGAVPPSGYAVTSSWLHSPRADFVDNNPDDYKPDATTGCTTLFLYYLNSQLGFSIDSIIAAGSGTLAGVWSKLTGLSTGAWTHFSTLVNLHYPPDGTIYKPAGDNLFPVSNLSTWVPPNPITCGYTDSSSIIFVDNPAMAQVNIHLTSADPSIASVPTFVTVPVGTTAVSIPITAGAYPGPESKSVEVTATYAEQALTTTVDVVPPQIAALTLTPTSVVARNSSFATINLNAPSRDGDVTIALSSQAPGFATTPPSVTIPQFSALAFFTVTTPSIAVAFPPVDAQIVASYGTDMAIATLTVTPSVVAGTVQSVTLFPSTVTGGSHSHGIVTLTQAVPTDTLVALAAVASGTPVASVPPTITIPAGQLTGGFTIKTKHLVANAPAQHATILATAVETRSVDLTVVA